MRVLIVSVFFFLSSCFAVDFCIKPKDVPEYVSPDADFYLDPALDIVLRVSEDTALGNTPAGQVQIWNLIEGCAKGPYFNGLVDNGHIKFYTRADGYAKVDGDIVITDGTSSILLELEGLRSPAANITAYFILGIKARAPDGTGATYGYMNRLLFVGRVMEAKLSLVWPTYILRVYAVKDKTLPEHGTVPVPFRFSTHSVITGSVARFYPINDTVNGKMVYAQSLNGVGNDATTVIPGVGGDWPNVRPDNFYEPNAVYGLVKGNPPVPEAFWEQHGVVGPYDTRAYYFLFSQFFTNPNNVPRSRGLQRRFLTHGHMQVSTQGLRLDHFQIDV